jgi:hypothetical protein
MSEFFSYKPEKGDDDDGLTPEEKREYAHFIDNAEAVESAAKAALTAEAKKRYPTQAQIGVGAMSLACLSMAASALHATMAVMQRRMAKGEKVDTGLAEMLLSFWDDNIVPKAEELRECLNKAKGK